MHLFDQINQIGNQNEKIIGIRMFRTRISLEFGDGISQATGINDRQDCFFFSYLYELGNPPLESQALRDDEDDK